jgi:hypothetical protein
MGVADMGFGKEYICYIILASSLSIPRGYWTSPLVLSPEVLAVIVFSRSISVSEGRNTKIVICPILSNRGSFPYRTVCKSRTVAKITSTGRCTTLRRLEEVLCASSTPQGPRWQSFHTAKQKTTTTQRNFLKNHPTCGLEDSHTCYPGLGVRQDTSVLAPL